MVVKKIPKKPTEKASKETQIAKKATGKKAEVLETPKSPKVSSVKKSVSSDTPKVRDTEKPQRKRDEKVDSDSESQQGFEILSGSRPESEQPPGKSGSTKSKAKTGTVEEEVPVGEIKKKIGRPKGSSKKEKINPNEDEVEFSSLNTTLNHGEAAANLGPKIRRVPFSAEITKAFVFKVSLESLTGLQRCTLSFSKNSIALRQTDDQDTILYDIDLPRKNLRAFSCKKPLAVSFNLKRMHGLLKNVKKKDSILLEIVEIGSDYKISVTIRPEGLRKNTRFETNSMVCQLEKNYKMESLPDGGYGHPMVIEAADFQKIKKMAAVSKVVTVTIQRSNYLSFECDAGVTYDSKLGFGELIAEGEDRPGNRKCTKINHVEGCECICEDCEEYCTDGCKCVCDGCDVKYSKGCECVCDGCDQLLRECECVCEGCGIYVVEGCRCRRKSQDGDKNSSENDSSDSESEVVDSSIFTQKYYSAILGKLVKLPALCSSMQFSYPKYPGYPLLIEAACSQNNYFLGTMKIYIKDVNQILLEEEIKAKEQLLAPSLATSSKSKKKI